MNISNNYSLFGIILPAWLLISGGFLFSLIITYFSIPAIIKISKYRNLYDIPNERTSHNNKIPVLGGLALFSGFALASIIFSLPVGSSDIRFILGGLIIILFLGLKDDIMLLDPRKKFLGQVIAVFIVVILGDIRITSFHNVLGIQSIGYIPAVVFTIFFLLLLINAFNLIDGVDGLSSGIGILSSLTFGTWFIVTGHYNDAILCFSLAGSLISYFIFNVFGRINKIFMGDTGAMIIGLLIAVFAIRFLETSKDSVQGYRFISAPVIAFGVLFIPLFDTLRIIIIRVINGKSPFKADKQHIHHLLLHHGLSHLQVSLILISGSVIILFVMFLLQPLGCIPDILITLTVVTIIFWFLNKSDREKDWSEAK